MITKVVTYRHKYRDRIDIISRILEIANSSDTKKTKIMSKAFLSIAN
jgi:predicted transcriptional regulator